MAIEFHTEKHMKNLNHTKAGESIPQTSSPLNAFPERWEVESMELLEDVSVHAVLK